jgi:nucleotide-binding universal stress UspA family protein
MYKHILIATDGSEVGGRGVAHGLALAKQLNAAVTIVTVTEMWSAPDVPGIWYGNHNPLEEYEESVAAEARKVLDAAAEAAKKAGIAVQLKHVKDKHPAEGIVEAAAQSGSDLIVMASHGRRGLGRLLLGSQTTEVLSHSKLPVLVVK